MEDRMEQLERINETTKVALKADRKVFVSQAGLIDQQNRMLHIKDKLIRNQMKWMRLTEKLMDEQQEMIEVQRGSIHRKQALIDAQQKLIEELQERKR